MTETPDRPVCTLNSYHSVLNGEATTISFIVFGWTRLGIEITIYNTQQQQIPLFLEMTILLNDEFSFDSCKPARLNNLPEHSF